MALDLDALSKLEARATPAPWHVSDSTEIDGPLEGDERYVEWMTIVTAKNEDDTEYLSLHMECYGLHCFAVPNSNLIAAARNALGPLLAEVKAAREWDRLQPTTKNGFLWEESDAAREAYRAIVEENSK